MSGHQDELTPIVATRVVTIPVVTTDENKLGEVNRLLARLERSAYCCELIVRGLDVVLIIAFTAVALYYMIYWIYSPGCLEPKDRNNIIASFAINAVFGFYWLFKWIDQLVRAPIAAPN